MAEFPEPSIEITGLLKKWGSGDADALNELTPKVYTELRRIARRYAHGERADNNLHATALVNEVYLRLVEVDSVDWKDRAHFFAVSAQMMRRILVDAARARATAKRGGNVRHDGGTTTINFNEIPDTSAERDRELLALEDALNQLGEMDPRKLRVVEMRFFGGLTAEETAAVLQISPQSVLRDWKLAKAWLTRELSRSAP
jgi:RNA polymerase sigma factor (TIGR02999 family)